MNLATTYICVKDMSKSIAFYKAVLDMEPTFQNEDRWIEFQCGNTISLYNRKYDEELMRQHKAQKHFNKAYINEFEKDSYEGNDIVVFNFECNDIKKEYDRMRVLNIPTSALMYVNIVRPYWYFTIQDPDGNELEITGAYTSHM